MIDMSQDRDDGRSEDKVRLIIKVLERGEQLILGGHRVHDAQLDAELQRQFHRQVFIGVRSLRPVRSPAVRG